MRCWTFAFFLGLCEKYDRASLQALVVKLHNTHMESTYNKYWTTNSSGESVLAGWARLCWEACSVDGSFVSGAVKEYMASLLQCQAYLSQALGASWSQLSDHCQSSPRHSPTPHPIPPKSEARCCADACWAGFGNSWNSCSNVLSAFWVRCQHTRPPHHSWVFLLLFFLFFLSLCLSHCFLAPYLSRDPSLNTVFRERSSSLLLLKLHSSRHSHSWRIVLGCLLFNELSGRFFLRVQ